jgi:hypothetical protein
LFSEWQAKNENKGGIFWDDLQPRCAVLFLKGHVGKRVTCRWIGEAHYASAEGKIFLALAQEAVPIDWTSQNESDTRTVAVVADFTSYAGMP